MRESASEGILGTGALGHIRFFFRYNHIALENLLVKVILSVFHESLVFRPLLLLADASVHFFILSPDLLARARGEVGADETKVRSIQLEKLF